LKVLLLYNPHAGHKRALKLLPEVEAALTTSGIDFDLRLTDYAEHGIDIVARADFSKYEGIVAAGGDGTLFEVINGFFKNKSSKRLPLGVVPIGTGNAFARDLNLHGDNWQKAIDIISRHQTKPVDVGYFKTHGQEYYFLNILGVGFVADVTHTAHKLKFLGNLSYTLGVFYRTIFLSPDKMRISLDGKIMDRTCTFIEVSNTRYTSNFLMAPQAEIDDGLFDITITTKLSRFKLLQSFPKIFTGEHVHLKEVETYQAKNISIDSETAKVLTPDGELVGITPVHIECLPGAIEVFWE
jgi:YegS/Rv2252/BmrU family lipid kinase